jgi:hypothetical protein
MDLDCEKTQEAKTREKKATSASAAPARTSSKTMEVGFDYWIISIGVWDNFVRRLGE